MYSRGHPKQDYKYGDKVFIRNHGVGVIEQINRSVKRKDTRRYFMIRIVFERLAE